MIARHYKWALGQIFHKFNYSTAIIVEGKWKTKQRNLQVYLNHKNTIHFLAAALHNLHFDCNGSGNCDLRCNIYYLCLVFGLFSLLTRWLGYIARLLWIFLGNSRHSYKWPIAMVRVGMEWQRKDRHDIRRRWWIGWNIKIKSKTYHLVIGIYFLNWILIIMLDTRWRFWGRHWIFNLHPLLVSLF